MRVRMCSQPLQWGLHCSMKGGNCKPELDHCLLTRSMSICLGLFLPPGHLDLPHPAATERENLRSMDHSGKTRARCGARLARAACTAHCGLRAP